MLKIYCTECGNPTTYTTAKPKFCSSCGTPFEKLVVNKVLLQKPTTDKPQEVKIIERAPERKRLPIVQRKANVDNEDNYDEDDYDSEDVNRVPNINGLAVDIHESNQGKTKIGDIIGSSKNQTKREKIKGKALSKNDRKKFLEDFKREAGSLRPKSRGQRDG